MENTDLKNNLFIQDYYHLINKEFITVLDNIDNICDNAPELNERKFSLNEEGESFNVINTGNFIINIFERFIRFYKNLLKKL